MHKHQPLNEGLENGDLKRLVHNELHIDEYRSKLGKDEDVAVLSFKVATKEPANDLVSFCEKGYEWILDADTSSGEMDDGDYLVFVELERTSKLPAQVMELATDLEKLTGVGISDWRVRYHKSQQDYELTENNIANICPLSAKTYRQQYGKEDIDKMKNAAGVKVDTKAPKNDFTESLRIAAGII